MDFTKVLLVALPMAIISLTSCSNDDSPLTDNTSILPYEVPTTYEFSRGEVSTVAHEEQNSGILMLTEMGSYIGSGKDNPLVATKLTDMYANVNSQFTTPALVGVASSINLKTKTASSKLYFNGGNAETTSVQNIFQNAFNDAVTASQTGAVASAGVAGKNGTRLYAANGLEPGQVVAKGMMGAFLMDQVLNNFLSKAVLDANENRINNTNKILIEETNYTEMEHAWDQAYGYIYGMNDVKKYFWNSYIDQVAAQTETFSTISTDILNAFIKGRAAITGNDYAERDRQIAIIRENLSKVTAIRGVHYLQEGKGKLGDPISSFHALSEGYGFIMSLRYTNNPKTNQPYFTKAEVDTMLNQLSTGTTAQPGFWDVDNLGVKLDAISTQIATKFGFTVADAAQG